VREHIADTWPELHAAVSARAFRRQFGALGGDKLTRVPRGFPSQHPAAEYLKHYRFVAGREFPSAFAHSQRFYPTLVATFKALMPLVRFLNEPIVEGRPEGLPYAQESVSDRKPDAMRYAHEGAAENGLEDLRYAHPSAAESTAGGLRHQQGRRARR
jgi:hypothetical protein